MSWLSQALLGAGVPKAVLDGIQTIINGYKAELETKIPTPAELFAEVKQVPEFATVYNALSDEVKAQVEATLEAFAAAALKEIREVLGV